MCGCAVGQRKMQVEEMGRWAGWGGGWLPGGWLRVSVRGGELIKCGVWMGHEGSHPPKGLTRLFVVCSMCLHVAYGVLVCPRSAQRPPALSNASF